MMNNKRKITISLVLMLFFSVFCMNVQAAKQGAPAQNVQEQFRRVWADHVIWTDKLVVSVLKKTEDKEAIMERLMKNQDDIGNSIKPYFGEKAAERFAVLMKEHITIADKVVESAMKGNKGTLEQLKPIWYRNADEMAVFLHSTNPKWEEKQIKEMLYQHLDYMYDNIAAKLIKDNEADIATLDDGYTHMQKFADYLSSRL